jgi:hypothetical protein
MNTDLLKVTKDLRESNTQLQKFGEKLQTNNVILNKLWWHVSHLIYAPFASIS